jgi:hypothetical protein
MSFQRAFQWYRSHADPIWPDGTFNKSMCEINQRKYAKLTFHHMYTVQYRVGPLTLPYKIWIRRQILALICVGAHKYV